MDFHFENHSPVYLQLAAILEEEIISSRFEPGQKLPSVRELAAMSQTNPNTAARAMQELENRGLIETRRTSGKYVAQNQKALEEGRMEAARKLCSTFLRDMHSLDYEDAEIFDLLKKGGSHAAENQKSEKEL